MKITDVRVRRLRAELEPPFRAAWDPVPRTFFGASLVFVETDEGITGVGSGDTMDGFEPFIPLFLHQSPLSIANHVRTLETISFHSGRFWPLEAALWDVIGQVCGQPVATLFGGSQNRLPAYASWGEIKVPEERAEQALALRTEGFRALKIRMQRDRIGLGLETVRAVRATVGDSMEIMVDLNQAWSMAGDIRPALDPAAARKVAAELLELDVFWLEEPLLAADIAGLQTLRAESGVRIAGGEMARTLDELLRYLEADALDVYQPDVVLAVGMWRARMIAEMALARNRWFSPHSWTNGLGLLANAHVVAGVGGGPFFEFPYDPPGWTVERRDFFLAQPLRIEPDGCIAIPDRPGLGAILDMEAIERLDME
jgi:D-galactarolactone cycloisomerase